MRGGPVQWLARSEAGIPTGDAWLVESERRRAGDMRFPKRRGEYLVRRLAGKCAVAATLGLPQDAATWGRIGVLNAPGGAPYVTLDGQPAGLEVSLTDRSGWAVCLVGRSLGMVGVDLELVEPRSAAFVEDFLAPSERAMVAACAAVGPEGHDAAANLVWSAKESAVKALRIGLGVDTRTVEVRLPDPTAPARPGSDGSWSSLTIMTGSGQLNGLWRREGVFLLTVAAEPGRALPAPVELPGSESLGEAAPLASWRDDRGFE